MRIKLFVYVMLAVRSHSQMYGAKNEPDWVDLIPDQDLQSILKAQAAAHNYMASDDKYLSSDDSKLFQGDLRGCSASNNPACSPATQPVEWRRNKVTSQLIIQYTISDSIDDLSGLIQTAHGRIEEQTCLLFDSSVEDETHYILYELGDICAADWPWGGSKKQVLRITLNGACVKTKIGNIQHLLLQALGFSKEITRNDRDRFIKIFWTNVLDGKRADFAMDDERVTYDDPYDYSSVLHPDYFFLSKSRSMPTISGTTKITLGQRDDLSAGDVKKINRTFCLDKRSIEPSKQLNPMSGQPVVTKTVTVKVMSTVNVPLAVTTITRSVVKEKLTTIYKTLYATQDHPVTVTKTVANTVLAGRTQFVAPAPIRKNTDTDTDKNEGNDQEVDAEEPSSTNFIQSISPTPTKRCSSGEMFTTENLQTMSRTTVYSVYPYRTLWEYSTKRVKSSMWLLSDVRPNEDWLAHGRDYPEFGGNVMTIRTTKLGASTVVLNTEYEQRHRPDGALYVQKKSESRIISC